MKRNNNFVLIFKALFTLEKKNTTNFIFLLRSCVGITQLIFFFSFYFYYKIKYFFRQPRKVNYIIGCIDIQANIIKLKEILGENNIAVNLRIEMKGKKYTGYWDIKTFDAYDYNFKNEKIGRLILGPILFAKLLNLSDKFIFVGSAGFFIPYIRVIDYLILKFLKKEVYSFFVGCDARARGPMIRLGKELNISIPCNGCSLVCEEKFRKIEADVHKEFNKKVFSSIDQTGYIKQFSSFDSFSFPSLSNADFDYNFNNISEIYIIHAASNPNLRGSNIISPVLEKIDGSIINGRKIKARTYLRVEKNILLEEMKRAHIYINTLNGLILGLGSAEAMAHGCILITGTSRVLNKDLPESYPGIQATNSNELYDALVSLIKLTDQELIELSMKSYDYAMNFHHNDFVGRNLIRELSS